MNDAPEPPVSGLSARDAAARLASEGPNELPSGRRRGLLTAAADVLREPMFLLLIACGGLYLLLSDRQEALMLLGFLVVVAVITLYQEQKTERALGERRLAGTEHLHPSFTLVRQYPLSEQLLAISQVWRSPDGADLVIAAKGAPEAIADPCHISPADERALTARVEAMAGEGLRVLGVALTRPARAGRRPHARHPRER